MGEAAALLSAFCWASTAVGLTRLGMKYSGAMLSGLRFLIASPFVIALLFITGRADLLWYAPLTALAAVVGSACVNYAIGDTMYVRALPRIGLQRMSPPVTGLWVAMSTLGGVLILGERASWNLLVGGALVIAGTYLVVAGRLKGLSADAAIERPGPIATLLIMLAVAASWATSTLLIAGARGSLDPIAVTALRVPVGGLLIALALTVTTRGDVFRRLPERADMPLILAIGIFGTALGGLAYVYAVAEAGAARAVILNATSPLMVVPLSMFFLGERPTARVGWGTAVCLAGTLIVVAGG